MAKRILVIGDVIIDNYTYGTKLGVSAETPTVVAEYTTDKMFLGGALLVVRHMLRLGCEVVFLTVGQTGSDLKNMIQQSSDPLLDKEILLLEVVAIDGQDWKYTSKHRYYVDDYKMVQYDVINRGIYNEELLSVFTNAYEQIRGTVDVLVISDNRHGVLADSVISYLMADPRNVGTTYVDVQVSQGTSNHLKYAQKGAFFFLNEKEMNTLSPGPYSAEDKLRATAATLGGNVALKQGALGSVQLVDNALSYVPAPKVDAKDTSGAGDAYMAAFVASGDQQFANYWAATSTTYIGTEIPSKTFDTRNKEIADGKAVVG